MGVKRDGSHPVIRATRSRCESAGAAVYAGRNFLTARLPDGRRIEVTLGNRRERMSAFWRNRERIAQQLAHRAARETARTGGGLAGRGHADAGRFSQRGAGGRFGMNT